MNASENKRRRKRKPAQLTEVPEYLRAFQDSGFSVSWMNTDVSHGTQLGYAFLRPNDLLKERFGFEYEVLLAYSKYSTLEPRTFQAIDRFLESRPAKGRVEAMIYFLVSEAENVEEWVSSYLLEHKDARIAVPFRADRSTGAKGSPITVEDSIRSHYLTLDRFKNTLPLRTDNYFFGRQREFARLLETIRSQENVGLFGLRKTGKTSLLLKLERHFSDRKEVVTVFLEAQDTSVRLKRWNELLRYICIQAAQKTSVPVEALDFSEPEASDSFKKYILKLCSSYKNIVLIVDEVEWISPQTSKDAHWNEDFINFWQAFRSFQTHNRALTIVLAGVNPSMVEQDSFGGFQNPLFGIVSPVYLTGLTQPETTDLMTKVGKVMGIRFGPDAIGYFFEQYGGHPLLTRLACSVTSAIAVSEGQTFPFNINASSLRSSADIRERELSFYPPHIVTELKKFYPDEYEVLELLAIGQYMEFLDRTKDARRGKHLFSYGVIRHSSTPYITIDVVRKYVASENARENGRSTHYAVVPQEQRRGYVDLRIRVLIDDMRVLEALVRHRGKPLLYGPVSFPEADRLLSLVVPTDANSMAAALTPLNRSFVESMDLYGSSIGHRSYFWAEIKNEYPTLQRALHRIRLYRNDAQHLELLRNVETQLRAFVTDDLEGWISSLEERYWILFQRCLDELQRSIHIEIARLDS